MLLLQDVQAGDEQELMVRLGMPLEASWVWMECPSPVTTAEPNTRLLLRDRILTSEQFRPSERLSDWDGLSFDMFGRVELETRLTDGRPLWRIGGDAVLEVWYARVFSKSDEIEVVATWPAGSPWRIAITAAGASWTQEALIKAHAAVHTVKTFHRTTGGRKRGDGATWPAGTSQFLADLWDAVDQYTADTGRSWPKLTGRSGQSFRELMKGHPSERTLREYLKRAGLRPHDVESGKVTRANYPQFVAEQGT